MSNGMNCPTFFIADNKDYFFNQYKMVSLDCDIVSFDNTGFSCKIFNVVNHTGHDFNLIKNGDVISFVFDSVNWYGNE